MTGATTRPPFDPELSPALELLSGRPALTPETLAELRGITAGESVDAQLGERVESVELTVPGYGGAGITLLVARPAEQRTPAPVVYNIHGGGMVMGDRRMGLWMYRDAVEHLGATVVSVEYRLAPEHPHPVPVEDCFAGLRWVVDNAADLGVDPDRLLLGGMSAGGGLALGTALLARERSGPRVRGLVVSCPMIDDRDATESARQFADSGPWDGASNTVAWRALLGDAAGGEEVSPVAAPARAADLSGLPPLYLDCGSADVLRDEGVGFASAVWAAGGDAELHIWPGGYHGFERYAPTAALSVAAARSRSDWIRRILA